MGNLSLLTSKNFDLSDLTYVNPHDTNKGIIGVLGEVMLVDSEGNEVVSSGGGAAGGGGNNTWSNAQGDFTATITNATKNITITGLGAFTLDWKHVKLGTIYRKDSSGVVSLVETSNISVSGGVITLSDENDNFVTGDEVIVTLFGPDKAYDKASDVIPIHGTNQPQDDYTSPEALIVEEDQVDATVSRYITPIQGHKEISLHETYFADTADDTITRTIWLTNDSTADDTADTNWVDKTNDLTGSVSLATTNTTNSALTLLVGDKKVLALKMMIKLVYVYGGGGSPNNSADVIVVKH